ncbi:Serine/threonine protein kinase [Thermostaphylospora chromogena]|uniref:Serine/threonine protein kinase n=2 Tax=Thermostaphylospora chromogena TaxID=35622 RepID=A0A1H1AHS5_9ACTN|nr:serine/threonine-protein kinase [Thermostaphylospora chromogena]SDQ39313.1 Serine/threonine protein kinase [Thermostaphylospora chromogena]
MVVPPDVERLGPYRLLSPIGAGGFGAVYIALDPQGHTVAVKVLHPPVAADSAAIARLAREVEVMRRVRGKHVAEVLDAELSGERPYLVTRYVQGRPLHAVVTDDGPITGDALARLARGLAAALASIHGAGVVHRDLKPANVILADGEPIVIDFGVAAALDSPSVTASGAVLGTPGYLAPEVISTGVSGPEADVFSFAATLAFAATGRQPYGTGPATAVAYRVVHEEPDLGGVPEWLAPLLRECMARDPAARPTAEQLCARLGASVPPPAPPVDAVRDTAVADIPPVQGVHGMATRALVAESPRPGLSPEDARARHAAKVRTRWVIGSGAITALTAAAAQEHLPEVSLLVLAVYACAVVADAGVALFRRGGPQRARLAVDVGSVIGTVAAWFALSVFFSTFTLVLALGTVLAVLLVIVVSS